MGCIRANFKYSCRGSETIPMVFGSILNIRVEVEGIISAPLPLTS